MKYLEFFKNSLKIVASIVREQELYINYGVNLHKIKTCIVNFMSNVVNGLKFTFNSLRMSSFKLFIFS